MTNHQANIEFSNISLEEANKKAEDHNFVARTASKNGRHFMLTEDYNTNRVNFHIVGNEVVSAYIG